MEITDKGEELISEVHYSLLKLINNNSFFDSIVKEHLESIYKQGWNDALIQAMKSKEQE